MKNFWLKLCRLYFLKFPIRKGKMPVLNFITKIGLTNVVKESTFDGNIKIVLDLNDWIQKQIYFFGYYEVEKAETIHWQNIVKEGQVILDIGANIGYYSLMASKRIENGQIHAFEPVQQTYTRLKHNVEINNIHNIKLNYKAVSDANGSIEIYVADKNNTGTSSITKHVHFNGNLQTVETITIDTYIKDENITRLDLIKIDVEGAEFMALKGMEATLKQFSPVILIELIDERLKAAGSSLKEAYDFLDNLNYTPYKLNKAFEVISAEKYKEGSLVIFKKQITD